jgi:pepF/M3 family oligoendopeptidase
MAETINKMTWDIESIFPGGSGSTEFQKFREEIGVELTKAEASFAKLPKKLDEDSLSLWVAFFLLVQYICEKIDHASGFTSCLTAQNVEDEKARIIEAEMNNLGAKWQALNTGIEDLAAKVDDTAWETVMSHEKLTQTSFYWNELRRNAKLKMEPKLEKMAVELAVDGYHAWGNFYELLAGELKVEFAENGKTEKLSMGQLATKFSSPDRDIRRQAFEKMEAEWEKVDSMAAMALNSQAGFRLKLYEGRGWDSPLLEPLLYGRLKNETIDAMWKAVARGNQKMAEYVTAKKKLLGIDSFKWYDQYAPVAGIDKKYSYDGACDFVVKQLSSFSSDMGEFAQMAINKRWIEAEDRGGKRAGAFCTGLDLKKETRIFMTFAGDFDQMMTLAHELGHSYHNWVLKDRDYFASQYTMNLAETASTFNELLVTDAALEASADDNERLALLDQKLQQGLTMFSNIYARFLFDTMFYEERKKGTVSKDRLGEMMISAQKKAFGDILSDDGYHPLFWASKLHFYITDMPFYNFPYTFGFLFAGGVYDRAKKHGPAFAKSYQGLLADTGSMTTEEVAQKHLGVDLTADRFWNDAVNLVLTDIDPFVKLVDQLSG